MSLFQCENCGCAENTALAMQGIKHTESWYDWAGIEDRKGMLLCSACAPEKYSDGSLTGLGEWHGEFDLVFLKKGEWKTNDKGNLEHVITGLSDFWHFGSGLKFE